MRRVLMVSKPVAPPWHDSSKNLVRDIAGHLTRTQAVLMTRRDARDALLATPGLSRADLRFVYSRARGPARSNPKSARGPARSNSDSAGGFAPALADQARVFASLLIGGREDLWHFFFAPNPRSSRMAKLAARMRFVRTVQTVCSAPAPHVDLQRVLFADRVIVVSRHTEARFLRAGISAQRLRLVAPAVTPLPLASEAARRDTRAELGLPLDAPIILYPGDLEISRGAERSLRLHAGLKDRSAWLVLACRAKTPAAREAEQKLHALAAELGTADRVRFLGETPRIHALLACSDVVVLPSEDLYAKMDLPLVLIEAMLLARPVLVLQDTAAAELADEDAALAVAADVAQLANAVQSLLDDAGAREQLGQRARAAALARYHPDTVAARYESIYDELT